MKQEEIEKYFDRCDFDDECDRCDDPQDGSYSAGSVIPEVGYETDYYICGKCAPGEIARIKEKEAADEALYDAIEKEELAKKKLQA